MRRFPDNLSAEDRRTYRRWVRGSFVFYSVAITIAVCVSWFNRPERDLQASNQTQVADLKPVVRPMAVPAAGSPTVRP
jgi:hypothetical protein